MLVALCAWYRQVSRQRGILSTTRRSVVVAGQRHGSAERRVPPGGSLSRGAALEVPDDSLRAWPAASTAPFGWARIPGERTSLFRRDVAFRQTGRTAVVPHGHYSSRRRGHLVGCTHRRTQHLLQPEGELSERV